MIFGRRRRGCYRPGARRLVHWSTINDDVRALARTVHILQPVSGRFNLRELYSNTIACYRYEVSVSVLQYEYSYEQQIQPWRSRQEQSKDKQAGRQGRSRLESAMGGDINFSSRPACVCPLCFAKTCFDNSSFRFVSLLADRRCLLLP